MIDVILARYSYSFMAQQVRHLGWRLAYSKVIRLLRLCSAPKEPRHVTIASFIVHFS